MEYLLKNVSQNGCKLQGLSKDSKQLQATNELSANVPTKIMV
jgi:hypothetical protein